MRKIRHVICECDLIIPEGIYCPQCGRYSKIKRFHQPPRLWTAHGKSLSMSEWAKMLHIEKSTLYRRMRVYNLPFEEICYPSLYKKSYQQDKCLTGHVVSDIVKINEPIY